MGTATAFVSPERTIGAIVLQISIGKYFFGIAVQPPVEQVKMVGGLVNPERTSRLP